MVLEIDWFGNLITNITADMLARPPDGRAGVRGVQHLRDLRHLPAPTPSSPGGSFIALIDSSGRLELAIVGDNAARRLGITVGTPVTVAWG